MNGAYSYLKFPVEAKVEKSLDVDRFLKAKNISEVERKIFRDVVKAITIKYMLNNSTTDLKNKTINGFTYQEIIVLEIDVNNPVSVYDVATVVGRAIFYPTMLFIRYNSRIKVGFIKNSFGKVNYALNIIKDIMFTGWINEKQLSSRAIKVLDALSYENVKKNNFYDTYSNYCNIIKEYKGSYISLGNAVKVLDDRALRTIPNLMLKLKMLCIGVNINNSISGIQIYKTSRIDKYIDENYNYTLLCVDDLYSYIEFSKGFRINNYETLLNNIKYQYRSNDYDRSVRASICNNCAYYNGYCCENQNIYKKTTIKSECMYFEGR